MKSSNKLWLALVVAVFSQFAQATAPVYHGQIKLDYVGKASNDGTFKWLIEGTNINIFSYCFSSANYFDPNVKPQVFNVWTIAGASASEIASSGMLSNNAMPGLTASHFLEAAAQAVSFGVPGITSGDAVKNDAIHTTESSGNAAFWAFSDLGVSNFTYLQQANPDSYTYKGQPQGVVGPVPEPATMLVLAGGVLGLVRRRRKGVSLA